MRGNTPEPPITVLSPHRGWFDWRLRQLWRYRDLIGLFVWRDFVSVYKQTALGPAWHIVRPLLTTLVFTVVFGQMARLSTDGVPAFLFYMAGNVAWSYFASCIDSISKTFVTNANMLGKVYFHRLVIPVSLVISGLIALGIQLAMLLAMIGLYRANGVVVHLTPWVVAAPVVVLLLGGYALAGGIIVSALTTRYRDLAHLITFGIQLLMYVTPVIYPLSAVPPRYEWIVRYNPLSPLLEAFRLAFLGAGTVSVGDLAGSAAVMLTLLISGLLFFTRIERSFMDTV
jgi:lipopolysaccharide transport system permease protein